MTSVVGSGVPPCTKGPEPLGTFPRCLKSRLLLFRSPIAHNILSRRCSNSALVVKEVTVMCILVLRQCEWSKSSKTFHTSLRSSKLVPLDTVESLSRQFTCLAQESSIQSRCRCRKWCISVCTGYLVYPQAKQGTTFPPCLHVSYFHHEG